MLLLCFQHVVRASAEGLVQGCKVKVGQQVTDSTVLCHIEVWILSTTVSGFYNLFSPSFCPYFKLKFIELATQNCNSWAGQIVVAVPNHLGEICHLK